MKCPQCGAEISNQEAWNAIADSMRKTLDDYRRLIREGQKLKSLEEKIRKKTEA